MQKLNRNCDSMSAVGDEPNEKGEHSEVVVDEDRPDTDEPARYAVFLHNDDYTTMEFVVEVLERFFSKSKSVAIQLMLKIHNEGLARAGIYNYEIAETKVAQVTQYARSKGFPLRCTLEKIDVRE